MAGPAIQPQAVLKLVSGLQDVLAQNLHSSPAACQRLHALMQRLLGSNCSNPAGPWLECCIRSYFLDKCRPTETVQFRIFETSLQQHI